MKKSYLAIFTAMFLVSACSDSSSESSPQPQQQSPFIDQLLTDKVVSLSLTGDPSTGRNLPDASSAIVKLGMQLFYSKALSGEMDTACVSCHHPFLGGGDALALSIGIEANEPDLLGPGRLHSSSGHLYDGGPTVPRNAPTTFNIGLYDVAIFHDGRIESIEGAAGQNGLNTALITPDSPDRQTSDTSAENLTAIQARFPVTSVEEMKGHNLNQLDNNNKIRALLVERLRGTTNELAQNEWLEAFRVGYGDDTGTVESLITERNLFHAIGEFERSQVFVNNRWNRFVNGETDAINHDEKLGALLFFNSEDEGGANCVSCHSGDFFTDEIYHNIAIPQLGRGKGDGENGTNDFGRFRVTNESKDMFAFRTPTLLNIAVTGPYGHSGAYESIEAIVRHHLNVESAVYNYSVADNVSQIGVQTADLTQHTQAALDKLQQDRNDGTAHVIQNVELTDEEISQLLAFLDTLNDTCLAEVNTSNSECLAPWVPSEELLDPDGLRLKAVFEE